MTTLNEWINMKIRDEDINYFEYNEFCNVKKIGEGAFGIVKKADWLSGGIIVALKVLANNSIDEDNMNKLFKELKNLRKVSFHPNINQFFGITKDPLSNKYVMVLQYANQGTLREYLLNDSSSLQWKDKIIQMALDITLGLKFLHFKEIIHRDLHSKNILVHNNKLMIADFGLSKQLTEDSSNSIVLGIPAYVEPQCFKMFNYKKDKKSDIYSLGVLLWELTSKRPPFYNLENQMISIYINNGVRETPVKNTSPNYIELYQKCWNDDPKLRPDIDEVYNILTHSKSQFSTINEQQEYQIIQNLNNLHIDDEVSSTSAATYYSYNLPSIPSTPTSPTSPASPISPTSPASPISPTSPTSNLLNIITEPENETYVMVSNEQELIIALDEIIRNYLKFNDIGWTKSFSFDKVLEKYESKSREIFNYLINNSTILHYEVIAGNFYKKGFGINKNEDIAFDWYIKASQKGDINGHYEVGYCYNRGYGIEKNRENSFEFYQFAANNGLNIAIKRLADFYQYVQKDKSKEFELYKISAENGFIPSQYELAICYKHGKGIKDNKREALKWFKLYQENDGDHNILYDIKYIEKELEDENQELNNAFDEIIQAYLKMTDIGWTKNFSFGKVLEKYRSKSQEIFKHLIDNPNTKHYEVIVGKFYEKGFGIIKNKETSFEWYMKASQKGDVHGHYQVGYYYDNKCDIMINIEKAVEFCQIAANNGLNIALYDLAFRYENGFGIYENKFKAFELYRTSAENGFIPSQYELAGFYNYGKGIQVNNREALKWYKLYQENDGCVNASLEIENIEEKLEQERIPKVKNRRSWFKRLSSH